MRFFEAIKQAIKPSPLNTVVETPQSQNPSPPTAALPLQRGEQVLTYSEINADVIPIVSELVPHLVEGVSQGDGGVSESGASDRIEDIAWFTPQEPCCQKPLAPDNECG
jgi:hypothetical protein